MVTTICFLDDVEAALKEVYRILKPLGHIIIGLIDKNNPIVISYQMNKQKHVFYKEATFFSIDKMVSMLKKVGFYDFSFKQTLFHPLNTIKDIEPIKEGFGDGSFIVIKAMK